MQHQLQLQAEIGEIRRRFPENEVFVVESNESWSPVAAVVIEDLRLPETVNPRRTRFRVPIPDLYGYFTAPCIAVVPLPVEDVARCRSIPFCEAISVEMLAEQQQYYVDVRENSRDLQGQFLLCVTPGTLPDEFLHVSIVDFVNQLLSYLVSPFERVESQVSSALATLDAAPHDERAAFTVLHGLVALGRHEEAASVADTLRPQTVAAPWVASLRSESQ
jgi:hypothetical protein